jgi:hypothetical protein
MGAFQRFATAAGGQTLIAEFNEAFWWISGLAAGRSPSKFVTKRRPRRLTIDCLAIDKYTLPLHVTPIRFSVKGKRVKG